MKSLDAKQLYRSCDPENFRFETTGELEDLGQSIGQERAILALGFGVGIGDHGFNLYVMGPPGSGQRTVVLDYLKQRAAHESPPPDICYVNCFEDPQKPSILLLPKGVGSRLRQDLRKLVEDLKIVLPAAFESEEYRASKNAIEDSIKERHDKAFRELQQKGEEQGVRLIRTSEGLVFAPLKEGKLLTPEEFKKLSPEEQAALKTHTESFHSQLHIFVNSVPEWEKEGREKIRDLNQRIAGAAVDRLMAELLRKYEVIPEIITFLQRVREDLLENYADFLKSPEISVPFLMQIAGGGGAGLGDARPMGGGPAFRRYEVNLLVDNSAQEGAPVIYEDNPTYQNLMGRVEHFSHLGTLATDFSLIKPGSLHRAHGGYLVVDAHKTLTQPFAWDALKRVLTSGEVRIESVGQFLSLVSTISLEPSALKIAVKVVVLGERILFELLSRFDPDFHELFKVSVDFEDQIERRPESDLLYARMIGALARRRKIRALDRCAVARVIEESSRLSGDSERLSARVDILEDLLREADYCAKGAGRDTITIVDVERALEQKIYRQSRLRDRIFQEIQRGTISVDLSGACVGRVNGLSVVETGGFAFGYPTVITARARLGRGEVVDIEREVKLGGPLHSKGVLILSGYLGGRYGVEAPLSVAATVVFEQSYGMVEGDSASSGELYALLSAIGEIPILQSWGVTGSVNQLGQLQAIGGVNEKIEGFFDVCRKGGLTGAQGVVIPESNVRHLMLRRDVVKAVAEGQFRIVAAKTVEDGIEVITGVAAAEVHSRVEARLRGWAEKSKSFTQQPPAVTLKEAA